jgi:hypothetical protein
MRHSAALRPPFAITALASAAACGGEGGPVGEAEDDDTGTGAISPLLQGDGMRR